jgi:hypothetical protein
MQNVQPKFSSIYMLGIGLVFVTTVKMIVFDTTYTYIATDPS